MVEVGQDSSRRRHGCGRYGDLLQSGGHPAAVESISAVIARLPRYQLGSA